MGIWLGFGSRFDQFGSGFPPVQASFPCWPCASPPIFSLVGVRALVPLLLARYCTSNFSSMPRNSLADTDCLTGDSVSFAFCRSLCSWSHGCGAFPCCTRLLWAVSAALKSMIFVCLVAFAVVTAISVLWHATGAWSCMRVVAAVALILLVP